MSTFIKFLIFAHIITNRIISLNWQQVTNPAIPEEKDSICAGYNKYKNSIWLLGGNPFPDEAYEYDITDNSFRTITLSKDIKCYSQDSLQIDNVMYNYADSGMSDYIITFDMTSQYLNETAIPKKDYGYLLHFPCMINVDDKYLLVLGGGENTNTNVYAHFSIWDLSNNQWISNGPPLLHPRKNFACNIYNSTLYIMGGYNTNELNSVHTIDVSDMSNINNVDWEVLSDTLSEIKMGMRSVLHNDLIYIIGGDKGSAMTRRVEVINPQTNVIEIDSNLVTEIENTGLVIAGNIIYAFGGNTDNGDVNLWQYSDLPTYSPTLYPTNNPTNNPTKTPSNNPSITPTYQPSLIPTQYPTNNPSPTPTNNPTNYPSSIPPTNIPTEYVSTEEGSGQVDDTTSTQITQSVEDMDDNINSGKSSDQLIIIIVCVGIFLLVVIIIIILIWKKKHKNNQQQLKIIQQTYSQSDVNNVINAKHDNNGSNQLINHNNNNQDVITTTGYNTNMQNNSNDNNDDDDDGIIVNDINNNQDLVTAGGYNSNMNNSNDNNDNDDEIIINDVNNNVTVGVFEVTTAGEDYINNDNMKLPIDEFVINDDVDNIPMVPIIKNNQNALSSIETFD